MLSFEKYTLVKRDSQGEYLAVIFIKDTMTNKYSPIIQQNASWIITLTLKDSGGTPLNLTNWTGKSSIKTAYDGTVLATPTVTITTPLQGAVTIQLTAAQTALLTPTPTQPNKTPAPVWDVLLSNSDNSIVYRVLEGPVVVLPGVTKWT